MKISKKALKRIIREERAKLNRGPLNEAPLHILRLGRIFQDDIVDPLSRYEDIEDRNRRIYNMIAQLEELIYEGQ